MRLSSVLLRAKGLLRANIKSQSKSSFDLRSRSKFRFGSTNVPIALILTLSLIGLGCSSQWISVALADLPVLAQIALNIGTMVSTFQSEKPLSPETVAIQSISAEAGRDLNLLQALYNDYKASPNADTIQKIDSMVTQISRDLPALLQAAHIGDPMLAARVTAGVNLIVTTVSSFATLIPRPNGAPPLASRSGTWRKAALPNARDLKKQWNQQVCAPSGGPAFDSATNLCALR